MEFGSLFLSYEILLEDLLPLKLRNIVKQL